MRLIRFLAAAGLAGMIGGCDNALEVENQNNPDRERVLRKPADVEALAGAQFQQIISATLGSTTRTHTGMLTTAFENASNLANNGLGPRGAIPRQVIDNSRGNAYQPDNFNDFRIHSTVARTESDVLARAKAPGFNLGTGTGNEQRLRAFAHFVYGVALGNLSLVYDSAGIPRPADGPIDVPALESYQAVNAYAIQQLDSALAYATMTGTTALPGGWLNGPAGATVSAATFARVIRSYRARIRAGVARTLTERAAVNWSLVVADATNGITSDLIVNMDPAANWDYSWLSTGLHFRDANWHQMPYYFIGMADNSGGYDAWLATARDSRTPFLIVTDDKRFPQGTTRGEQADEGRTSSKQPACGSAATPRTDCVVPTGRFFRNRDPGLDQQQVGWQASWYDHYRWRAFANAGRVGPFPIFTRAENDMLAAEGYLRLATPNIAAAAALIDRTRADTLGGGLPPLTGAVASLTDPVPGGARCVPRVPQGPAFTSTACGTIMDAMKWEKRMATAYTTYGAWFFDARGWGELPEGTALHWPVPNIELDARLLPIYNLGGVGQPAGAPASIYGFGSGQR